MDLQKEYCELNGYTKFNKYNENDYTKFLEKKINGLEQALQLKQTDVKQSVCNYCLEFVGELPDKFGCKDCIEKYTKQTDSFFCTKTQNNEPKCKTECNFCKDMQKEYEELKNDL